MAATEGRPTVAEVSLGALRHNCEEARRLVGDAVRVMAIVKADGYGHGSVPAARTFLDAGAGLLGVSTVAEGAALRSAGIDAPIVALWGAFAGEAESVVDAQDHRAWCVVRNRERLHAQAGNLGHPVPLDRRELLAAPQAAQAGQRLLAAPDR